MLTPEHLDAALFERLAAEGRYREALALWRGEPLQGMTFEGLAASEAERLGEQRLAVLERRIEADLAAGRDAELVAELQELVAAHPLRERLRAQLMLALYRSGRQADALAVYRDTRSFLADELGLEPGEELRRLQRLMLDQDPELDAPRRGPRRRADAGAAAARRAPAQARRRPGAPRSASGSTRSRCTRCSTAARDGDRAPRRHGRERVRRAPSIGVFGLEQLHEDDALRAARAAAELRDAGEPVRLGIDAGEVFVAAGARRETFATGGADRRRRRARRAAPRRRGPARRARPPGSSGTARRGGAVGGEAWRLDELADRAAARGPAADHRVRRPRRASSTRSATRSRSPTREQAARLLAVVGPPGIGKSRLAARGRRGGSRDDATVVVGRCVSYGDGITYRPLAEIVRQLGDARRGCSPATSRRTLIGRRVLGAIGRSDEPAQPEEMFWAVRRLFEAAARERPLVVVIEDVHWAEPALLDLLDYLAAFSSGAPILLVCLGRPELLERRPAWAAPQRGARCSGSTRSATIDALALVARRSAPQGLAARRWSTAPRATRCSSSSWWRSARRASCRRRSRPCWRRGSTGSTPDERALLEHAAVEGRSFHRGALAALLGDDDLTAPLTALVRQQLIRAERPSTRARTRSGSRTR